MPNCDAGLFYIFFRQACGHADLECWLKFPVVILAIRAVRDWHALESGDENAVGQSLILLALLRS